MRTRIRLTFRPPRPAAPWARAVGAALLACLTAFTAMGCASMPTAASFGPEQVEVRGETRIRANVYR